jgi:hypothetical protein
MGRVGLVGLSLLLAAGCGTGAATSDGADSLPGGDGAAPPGDESPGDPAGCEVRPLARLDRSRPAALIVTSPNLASAFAALADFHTTVGVTTEVVTTATICGGSCDDGDPLHDTARALKAHLAGRQGLRYVILGGDIEVVPSRQVHDRYENPFDPSYTYEADFYTDYYFADLSQWDGNGDGTYAEDGVDDPDYLPDLAVARIPASGAAEVAGYLAKVKAHAGAFPTDRLTQALLVSDIAANYGIDIDSAWYFEDPGRSLDLLETSFTVSKLYATGFTPDSSAPALTLAALEAAIASGVNLVVHNGHGSEGTAIYTPDDDLTGARAAALTNTVRPILLSCACQAGAFNEPDQYIATDSAGERLVMNPNGGAVAYLGNTTVGLGLAGGSQLIDEMLRYITSHPQGLLGDALFAAHEQLPPSDTFTVPIVGTEVPVVDQTSYEWTQKTAVLLGDPLLPVWTAVPGAAPTLTLSATSTCAGTRITVRSNPATSGTLRLVAGSALYEVAAATGTTTLDIAERPSRITAGLVASGRFFAVAELEL